mmetsp:Transcript_4209/g.11868  ORF Transcript_4209/g.11868 Transcript_4209/m.11868 type:complete len:213 (+) Transcript_4209:164-802(+)
MTTESTPVSLSHLALPESFLTLWGRATLRRCLGAWSSRRSVRTSREMSLSCVSGSQILTRSSWHRSLDGSSSCRLRYASEAPSFCRGRISYLGIWRSSPSSFTTTPEAALNSSGCQIAFSSFFSRFLTATRMFGGAWLLPPPVREAGFSEGGLLASSCSTPVLVPRISMRPRMSSPVKDWYALEDDLVARSIPGWWPRCQSTRDQDGLCRCA